MTHDLNDALAVTRFLMLMGHDRDDVFQTIQREYPDADVEQILHTVEEERERNEQQLSDALDREAIEQEHRT